MDLGFYLGLGRSANVAELCRQITLRRYHRVRFFGVVVFGWQIGFAHYLKSPGTPTKEE